MVSYQRIIPRDLFNESKLLKCLGQVALLLHDGAGHRWQLSLEHDDSEYPGFQIGQNPQDASLFCDNVRLMSGDQEISLFSIYNSKNNYPLLWQSQDGTCGGYVLTDDGQFHQDLTDWLKANR